MGFPYRRAADRRGVVYLLTLGTALIVGVLGLASLMVVRIQRKQIENFGDSAAAERYARAALDMALFEIEHNSSWRSDMAQGKWETDQPIGTGSYSFQAVDPTDADLTDAIYDPVVVVGTGKSGRARHKLQARINVRLPGLRCLEPAIHADYNFIVDASLAQSDHIFSANRDIEATNSAVVDADVEAANAVMTSSGGMFLGSTTTEGDWPRAMPDRSTVFDYYINNGTPISIYDLPMWDANLLGNPGIESSLGQAPWYSVDCSISSSTMTHSGQKSLRVHNRNAVSDTVAQDVTAELQSGITYHAEAWLMTEGMMEDTMRIVLRLVSTGDGERLVPFSNWTTVNGDWKLVAGDATVNWTGSLEKAEWFLQTDNDSDAFRIDDAEFKDANAPADWYTIHRKVLSPANNPFGTGITNPQGIYILDCNSENLSIRDSRISGTLVLINQNNNNTYRVQRSVLWSPALISADPAIANLPALLTERNVDLAFGSTNLNEGQVNVNFNPEGTPYNGATDTDKADVYPSKMNGVVYSGENINIGGNPRFYGVVVADRDILATGTDLGVRYDPVYFEENAPPGFRREVEYYIVPGSIRRVVD